METTDTDRSHDDISAAIDGIDPQDKAAQIQADTEDKLQGGDPEAKREAELRIDRQQALRETFGYVNTILQEVAPELEHSDDQLHNLSVLWGEVIKDVPAARIQEWIENLPLLAASAYTVVTTGPKAYEAYERRILGSTPDSLESTNDEPTGSTNNADANRRSDEG